MPTTAADPRTAAPYHDHQRFAWVLSLLVPLVPLLWGAFVCTAWFSQSAALGWAGQLGLVIATGGVGGFCIKLGHEIGHKHTPLERWLAKIILAPRPCRHFTIEHNHDRHRDVATPQDPASARMGESIWAFVRREMPGAWQRAWALKSVRLRVDRRPERRAPQHSWCSNHVFSNWDTVHRQRRRDHHAQPLGRYQSRRPFEAVPQWPEGRFGMFTLAYLPPLWFVVMDKRLVQAVGNDATRINFQPGQRQRLIAKFALHTPPV